MSITAALYSRLANDATLASLLAKSVIDGSSPAVYTALPPATAQLPYVVIPGAVSDVSDDAFDAEYRRVLRDIACYADRPDGGGGSVVAVEQIAERVRALLHRKPLTLSGNPRNLVCEISGPIANDDEAAFGRVLTARLLVAVNA